MSKLTKTLILTTLAAITMGMSLPGCQSGDIAQLQTNQDTIYKRLKNLEDFATKTQKDNLALGQAMLTLNDRYTAAAGALKTANDNILALQAQINRKAAAPAPKKTPPKKRK